MDLPVSLLDGFGTVAVVVLVFWLLATGRISTKREVDHLIALYETQAASLRNEADEWRAAAQISGRQAEAMLANQKAMATQLHTAVTFIESLPKDGPR